MKIKIALVTYFHFNFNLHFNSLDHLRFFVK